MKSDFAMMKSLAVEAARLHPDMTAMTGSSMIGRACMDAYHELDCLERGIIRQQKQYLMDMLDIGEQAALELLASVSEYVGGQQ